MTNEEWMNYVTTKTDGVFRTYKALLQDISPSLEDSIALLLFLTLNGGKSLNDNDASLIKQFLYKNFPSQKAHERINYFLHETQLNDNEV